MLAVIVAGMLIASHVDGTDGGMRLLASAGAGYGMTGIDSTCLVNLEGGLPESPCDQKVKGPAFSLGAGVLWGDTARFGFRADGSYVPSDHARSGGIADLLAIARYHGPVIVEIGMGAGHVWSKRDGVEKSVGFAGSFLFGVPLSDQWAIFARGVFVTNDPGAVLATAGVEWSFYRE